MALQLEVQAPLEVCHWIACHARHTSFGESMPSIDRNFCDCAGYSNAGCWFLSAVEQLPVYLDEVATIADCFQRSAAANADIFGVVGGNACWASQSKGGLDSATAYGTSLSCNMKCAGNSSEVCGGVKAVSLYTIAGETYLAAELTSVFGPSSITWNLHAAALV